MNGAGGSTNKLGTGANQYLLFRVRHEEFAVPASLVLEIRTIPGIEAEKRQGLVCGSIELHGRAIPVLDLSERFGQAPAGRPGRHYVIVLPFRNGQGQNRVAGVLVDAVSNVVVIPPERISSYSDGKGAAWRIGRVRIHGRFKCVLDVDRLLDGLTDSLWQAF